MSNATWSTESTRKHAFDSAGSARNCSSYLISNVIAGILRDKEAFKLSLSRFPFSTERDLIELKAAEGEE
jgi:hypothetical protein